MFQHVKESPVIECDRAFYYRKKNEGDVEDKIFGNVDPNFESNDALKDAVGYIVGMGFALKAKPHAFASSG